MNYLVRDPAAVEADVEYTMQIAHRYSNEFKRLGVSFAGTSVLELGPGRNLGWPLIMAARGARVTVSDVCLVAWDRSYHPEYYRRLADRCEGSIRDEIKRVTKDGGSHEAFPIRQLQEPAETLPSVADGSCDVVLSHAVLEHVFDLPTVVKTLARVTAMGGVNIHQIDFRDHRDYDRPLEFLLPSNEEFLREPDAVLGRGNRWRLSETLHLFEQADFEVLESLPDSPCDPEYLAEFLRRLPSGNVRFRNADHEDLSFGGAHVTLRRIQ